MKKIYLTLLSCFIAIVTMAQTPGFSYQAVILNPNTQILPGNNLEQGLLSESNIMLRFTIQNDGSTEYQETHLTKTDAYGMVSLMVGQGMATIGNFTDVAWVGSEKYLKVEIDFTASGASYESLDRQALTYLPQPVSNETMAILDQINTDVSSNNDVIQNEVTRATIAEQANTDALDAEITRATTSEGVNATAISDETNRATAAEGVNATAIADETTRATAAEQINATAIADETTRATAAELANATAIADETTRATTAEGVNALDIDTNATDIATNALDIDTNATAIAALVSKTDGCSLSIGDTAEGGIIFYLDPSGCHGLVSALTDQQTGNGATWYNPSCTYGRQINGFENGPFVDTRTFETGLFGGKYNTWVINFLQGGSTSAAAICSAYTGGSFNDWYLPSIEELNKMYLNIGNGNSLGLGNIGGFANRHYWSSTEIPTYIDNHYNHSAFSQEFGYGQQTNFNKSNGYLYVRAIRAF